MSARGRLLLTGGAGFIGSGLARALLARGWALTVLDKLTYAGRREHLEGLDLELVVGDVCDAPLVAELMQGVDVVVHAAAESHVARALVDPAPFFRTNVEGTRVVLTEAAAAGVAHCVHVSTDEVFGSAPEGEAFAVDAPLRPGNFYAASKAAAEALVHAVAHTRGFRASVVRCTNNYGPRQHLEKAIPTWTRAASRGEPIPVHGAGEAIRDWLHVEDFCAGVVALIDRGEPGGVYHFSGGNSRMNREVAARIAALCGGGALRFTEDRPGQDARYALDDAATRDALGWAPEVPFERGLAETVAWYQANAAP
ncbi:MAG: NAD-dependent epimerase/dehydratase family protein [Alphaproteobacteria bacterium]|nr:NAD-dependent epimerase/dehydratase family protein [Alphaproteobacteria bacterium]MCB9792911.1 NAD-dependent epimerase/dehydratase family protein [Alphaproteobacteria bacterium]